MTIEITATVGNRIYNTTPLIYGVDEIDKVYEYLELRLRGKKVDKYTISVKTYDDDYYIYDCDEIDEVKLKECEHLYGYEVHKEDYEEYFLGLMDDWNDPKEYKSYKENLIYGDPIELIEEYMSFSDLITALEKSLGSQQLDEILESYGIVNISDGVYRAE